MPEHELFIFAGRVLVPIRRTIIFAARALLRSMFGALLLAVGSESRSPIFQNGPYLLLIRGQYPKPPRGQKIDWPSEAERFRTKGIKILGMALRPDV